MIRTHRIIHKSQFFELVEDPAVSRVEIYGGRYKTLRNKELCKVYIYYKADQQILWGILGACLAERSKLPNNGDHAFLTGIQSLKKCGFITVSKINRLIEIEKKYKINLNIPKALRKLIKTCNQYI